MRRRDLGGTAPPEGSGEGDAMAAGVERFQRQCALGQTEGRRRVVGHQAQFAERQQMRDVADADLVRERAASGFVLDRHHAGLCVTGSGPVLG